jgi:hypothetical protein
VPTTALSASASAPGEEAEVGVAAEAAAAERVGEAEDAAVEDTVSLHPAESLSCCGEHASSAGVSDSSCQDNDTVACSNLLERSLCGVVGVLAKLSASEPEFAGYHNER